MFFDERIQSIKPGDTVLDIGPGSDPYPRADVLLEIEASEEELAAQRGHTPPLKTDKKTVYYDGKKFPFKDNEFDYVICSHVLEHVDDPKFFVKEVMRVARRGYFEFPTIYYDYLYNFDVHLNFLRYDEEKKTIYFMKKENSDLAKFQLVQNLFYASLVKGYDDIIRDLKDFMFQGFEWDRSDKLSVTTVTSLDKLVSPPDALGQKQVVQPQPPSAQSAPEEPVVPSRSIPYRAARKLYRVAKKASTLRHSSRPKDSILIHLNDIAADIEVDKAMHWTFSENKYYEENVAYWYKNLVDLIEKGRAAYDIGANYGYYSMCAAAANKEVVAFEPSSEVRKKLLKNMARNNLKCKVMPFAISDKSGSATFNIYSSSGNNSLISRDIPEGHELKHLKTERVKVATLDEVFSKNRLIAPDLIKIDVEGAELFALKGGQKVIKKYRPSIIVEYSAATSNDAGYDKKEIYRFLKDLGYEPFGLSSDNTTVTPVAMRSGSAKNVDNIVALSAKHLTSLKKRGLL